MKKYIDFIEQKYIKKDLPNLRVGDVVSVTTLIREGNKERTQAFEGFVLAIQNKGMASSFYVRKVSHGEGVEKSFNLHSPNITSIKILKHSKVRQSKLYYMRELSGKAARLRQKLQIS